MIANHLRSTKHRAGKSRLASKDAKERDVNRTTQLSTSIFVFLSVVSYYTVEFCFIASFLSMNGAKWENNRES